MSDVPQCTHEEWARARPDIDASSIEVIGPLKRAQALIDLGLEPLFEGAPVTSPELDLLVTLRHVEQPVIARHLMRLTNRSAAGMSKMLRKLHERDLIDKEPSPADRRAWLVSITEHGRTIVDDLFPRQLALESQLLDDLGTSDRTAIITALSTLVATLESHRARG